MRDGGNQVWQLRRVVREVGVHLAEDVVGPTERAFHAVNVRPPEPAKRLATQDVDPPGMLTSQAFCQIGRAVGRLVVHHEQVHAGVTHERRDQQEQVRAFVVGGHDDQHARRHGCRLSTPSEAICSETSPTRTMMTLRTINSTEELVTCDCVRVVQTP